MKATLIVEPGLIALKPLSRRRDVQITRRDRDGRPTRARWGYFSTEHDARRFAKKKGITIVEPEAAS